MDENSKQSLRIIISILNHLIVRLRVPTSFRFDSNESRGIVRQIITCRWPWRLQALVRINQFCEYNFLKDSALDDFDRILIRIQWLRRL